MATELQVIHANLLPEASNITDADMILIIQSGRPKRALPSAMKGDKGDNVYMGLSDTHILWKIGMNGSWQNLIAIESLRGKQGYKPAFRKVGGTLQVKYENEDDSAYVNIFEKEELKLQFSDLTAEEVEQLKLHFSDLTAEDIAVLQQPATDAAAEVREAAIEWENEENVRKSNEAERIEAEASRKAAETSRSEAESTRQSNEQTRETAESTREENETERQNREATRYANESARQLAEDARSAAEAERKANEEARQSQESDRQTNTNVAIANAEKATSDANTAAQNAIKAKENTEAATELANELNDHPWIIQQGVWYKWNTDTDQYESTGLQAKGDTGSSFNIVGIYPTIDDLKAAVPDGTDVDGVYAVGTGDPYNYYAWVFYNDAWQWVNQGQLRGPEGKSAYEVWLGHGNEGKSYADYIAYLQQPAMDAADIANQAAEAASQSKEAADQAEALRAAAEAAREQAESSRQSAEAAREQAESDRGEAEDLRQTNEDARQAAELTRKANEDARQAAETARQTAEDDRAAAEAARATAENNRSESENLRAESEITRQQAETARIANESNREASETERQTNELQRQSNTATAISNAEAATATANEAAAKANDAAIAANTAAENITRKEVPTLESAPTEETVSYVNSKGDTIQFYIGDECRVMENGEYTFYKLYDLVNGVASWDEIGSGLSLTRNLYLQSANYYNESVQIVREGDTL